jgi:hypothetical protein
MDIYRRVKLISQYSPDKPTGIKSMIKCGQCEKDDAQMVSRKLFFFELSETSKLIF